MCLYKYIQIQKICIKTLYGHKDHMTKFVKKYIQTDNKIWRNYWEKIFGHNWRKFQKRKS